MDAEITPVEVERFLSPQRPSGCSTKMMAAVAWSFIPHSRSMGRMAYSETACSEGSTLRVAGSGPGGKPNARAAAASH